MHESFLNKKREAMKKFFRKCLRCLEILGEYGMQKYGMKLEVNVCLVGNVGTAFLFLLEIMFFYIM